MIVDYYSQIKIAIIPYLSERQGDDKGRSSNSGRVAGKITRLTT